MFIKKINGLDPFKGLPRNVHWSSDILIQSSDTLIDRSRALRARSLKTSAPLVIKSQPKLKKSSSDDSSDRKPVTSGDTGYPGRYAKLAISWNESRRDISGTTITDYANNASTSAMVIKYTSVRSGAMNSNTDTN